MGALPSVYLGGSYLTSLQKKGWLPNCNLCLMLLLLIIIRDHGL